MLRLLAQDTYCCTILAESHSQLLTLDSNVASGNYVEEHIRSEASRGQTYDGDEDTLAFWNVRFEVWAGLRQFKDALENEVESDFPDADQR